MNTYEPPIPLFSKVDKGVCYEVHFERRVHIATRAKNKQV